MLLVDLIVLAGGRGSRLGGVLKPAVEVAGRTLLSRVLDARPVARHAVVVGPPAAQPAAAPPGTAPAAGTPLIWALEDPPFGGPVAGLAAGLAALDAHAPLETNLDSLEPPAGWLLVLACDLPWGADAARLLVAAASALEKTDDRHDGVHLVDSSGHAQWLAAIYRAPALRAAVARLGDRVDGASMRQLLTGLQLEGLRDDSGAGIDVDTWQDVTSSTVRLTDASVPDYSARPEE
jgi:molybdopterin-guanine dinucleotide biosynthesis protein A